VSIGILGGEVVEVASRSCPAVGRFTVFNIKGNNYRLILNGKREISKAQARKLGEFFNVSPSVFI
jgi:mRNA-degrading endonuclease HigB of HigAB toxin-antitoxin module